MELFENNQILELLFYFQQENSFNKFWYTPLHFFFLKKSSKLKINNNNLFQKVVKSFSHVIKLRARSLLGGTNKVVFFFFLKN